MRDDELDRIFSDETGIEPSPDFAATVMEAVRLEASTPPPIPFPWKCALPGLAAWIVVVVVVMTQGFGQAAVAPPSTLMRVLSSLPNMLREMLAAARTVGAGWIGLALLLALASMLLSLRFTRGHA